MSESAVRALAVATSARYASAGRSAVYFARGKLLYDPVFRELLAHGLLSDRRRLLDLGCGRGLLPAWLQEARVWHAAGRWPPGWPAPPVVSQYLGIELSGRDLACARAALSPPAEVTQGDIRATPFPPADTVAILDVLHYVPLLDQLHILRRVRSALASRGVLLLRVGDAGGGLPFRLSGWVDRVVASARGRRPVKLYCRPLAEWEILLAGQGFAVQSLPMSHRTPFANALLVARVP